MSYFPLTTLSICALMLIRNELVFRHSMRRIEAIHQRNKDLIDAGDFDAAERGLEDYGSPHHQMRGHFLHMLDLRKWTYRQFFGEAPR
jgi:hypothetical protein